MDAVVHRIEALPGAGRYAVTWLRTDGSEQTAVVHVRDDALDVAEASLPPGCAPDTAMFAATAAAVRALDEARRLAPARQLGDVDGGWDVSLGNVHLDPGGTPACTAHGPMQHTTLGEWLCAVCGARALLG
jgi:hypothetical protein